MLVEATPSDGMRVILCLKFNPHAVVNEVKTFKERLTSCTAVVHSVEATGAFDFMVEAGLADSLAYQALLDQFADEFASLVEHLEASFVCRRFIRACDHDDAIWVPCRNGRRRISCAAIDRVCAEGDYVRLHCGEQSWLLHDTMRHIREVLDPASFLTVHRSTIVNIRFIGRLIDHGHYGMLVLADDGQQRVSKSHLAEISAVLRSGSPNDSGLAVNRKRVAEPMQPRVYA